jgi:hypothetical protein
VARRYRYQDIHGLACGTRPLLTANVSQGIYGRTCIAATLREAATASPDGPLAAIGTAYRALLTEWDSCA